MSYSSKHIRVQITLGVGLLYKQEEGNHFTFEGLKSRFGDLFRLGCSASKGPQWELLQ